MERLSQRWVGSPPRVTQLGSVRFKSGLVWPQGFFLCKLIQRCSFSGSYLVIHMEVVFFSATPHPLPPHTHSAIYCFSIQFSKCKRGLSPIHTLSLLTLRILEMIEVRASLNWGVQTKIMPPLCSLSL